MTLSFTKLVGTGNDFVLLDRRRRGRLTRAEGARLARKLCNRKVGIGADGILVLEASRKADYRMRIFNPDGTEAEMCGNGSRCAAYYVSNGRKGCVSFETLAGLLEARVRGNRVRVRLTKPRQFRLRVPLRVAGKKVVLHTVNTGVPHAVLLTEDLEGVDLVHLGGAIRRHPAFRPRGTNVDFVRRTGPRQIAVRTYERGVEGETLACGTGVTASALVAAVLFGFSSPITVLTRGGERLKIFFRREGNRFTDVSLEGNVFRLFEGSMPHV